MHTYVHTNVQIYILKCIDTNVFAMILKYSSENKRIKVYGLINTNIYTNIYMCILEYFDRDLRICNTNSMEVFQFIMCNFSEILVNFIYINICVKVYI